MFTLLCFIIFLCTVMLSRGHGFLARPVSRNAVGIESNGFCQWGDRIPCTGCAHCFNQPEITTGCGIIQSRTGVSVYGNGELSYANTGVKTTYMSGQTVSMEVIIPVYHGGHFQFRIQDVGDNSDPDGSQWRNLEPLTVESFYPQCDDVSQGCGPDPCLSEKTCATIPLRKYGVHNDHYIINVTLPHGLVCSHCVLQWHWLTGNSCWPDWVACEGSEEFWNCADLEILPSDYTPPPTAGPPPTPTPACSTELGEITCSGHGIVKCPPDVCWRPVWKWPNDYCELRTSPCAGWERDQGGLSWEQCCAYGGHCKGTGLSNPHPELCQCQCFDGYTGENCNICAYEFNTTLTAPPSFSPTLRPTVSPTNPPSPRPSPDRDCENQCYSTTPCSVWYYNLVDSWCQIDCAHLTERYPSRCITGCRDTSYDNTVTSLQDTVSRLLFGVEKYSADSDRKLRGA